MRVREKKEYVIFTFHTTAAAMATEKLCQERNIPGRLIPAPRSITADCGIAWAAPPEERERIEKAPGLPALAGVCLRAGETERARPPRAWCGGARPRRGSPARAKPGRAAT